MSNLDKIVSGMTRAQAERAVAATSSLSALKLLGDHKNSHVRAKANYKYKALTQAQSAAEIDMGAIERRLVEEVAP